MDSVVTLLAALALAVPPKATLDTGAARVPLAISSWCWSARCGAPFASAKRLVRASRGSHVGAPLTP